MGLQVRLVQLLLQAQSQLKLVLSRQLQLKKAAMEAKQSGDIPKAKELLSKAKSLEGMVEAARGGLPVDVKEIPPAPFTIEVDEVGEEVAAQTGKPK